MKRFSFEPDPRGELRIWIPPNPQHSYVIGIDVAEGKVPDGRRNHGDYSVGFVINGRTLEHCATWHGKIDPWPFSDEMATLGRYYNNALLAPEKNNHGLVVIKRLLHDLGYEQIFQQRYEPDRRKGFTKPRMEYGITTSSAIMGGGSKAMLVDLLRAIVMRVTPIHDPLFCTEGITWILDDRGRPKTNEGAHDDVLMAAAFAYYAAKETFGGALLAQKNIQIGKPNKERVRRAETWRKILKRTEEVQTPPDPWKSVPEEIQSFYR